MTCLPTDVNPKDLITFISELCWDIDDILKYYTYNNFNLNDFKKKLDIQNLNSGPVTNADIEINDLIKKRISEKYPKAEWEFLSEEDKKNNDSRIFNSKWVWIIDPLDGTKDFIKGTGEYAIHLALTYEKSLIMGFVLIPVKEELWINFKSKGTWCESRDGLKKSSFLNSSEDLNQLTILTSKSHFHSKFEFLLKELNPKNVLGMGSVGYKITSILRGEGDIYISYSLPNGSSPKDWDMAAPLSLIEGAGGYFTDINGCKLDFLNGNFDQSGILIASLNSNHKEICKEISKIIK